MQQSGSASCRPTKRQDMTRNTFDKLDSIYSQVLMLQSEYNFFLRHCVDEDNEDAELDEIDNAIYALEDLVSNYLDKVEQRIKD